MARIFCSGPLFNPPERDEMQAIATSLERHGHCTYLAQRDGLEELDLSAVVRDLGLSLEEGIRLQHRGTFALDAYYLLDWADIVVANLNGRVPDEGMAVECALAWMKPIPIVLYKNDSRAPFAGYDNLMLTQLASARQAPSIEAIPPAVEAALGAIEHVDSYDANIQLGKQISEVEPHRDTRQVAEQILSFWRAGS